MRGAITGLMTTFLGGLGHTLPYLIPDVCTATTVAVIVVFVELFTIAWIQNKYMDTPLGKPFCRLLSAEYWFFFPAS